MASTAPESRLVPDFATFPRISWKAIAWSIMYSGSSASIRAIERHRLGLILFSVKFAIFSPLNREETHKEADDPQDWHREKCSAVPVYGTN